MDPGVSIDSMKQLQRYVLLILSAIVLLPAFAGTTGRVNGILKDAGGMPVAGAKLTLSDRDKGTTVTVTSDRKGTYAFPIVAPGTYKLRAEAQGYRAEERPSVMVHVDSAVKLDLTLEAADAARPAQ
jgi:hypothetical protein